MLTLDGCSLAPPGVADAAGGAAVRCPATARARNAAARRVVEEHATTGRPFYGVTTGVGVLRDRPVETGGGADHQLRLLRSHAAGTGEAMPPRLVRAAM